MDALNRHDLRQFISHGKQDPVIHTILLDHLKTYMWLGGLPAVVEAWIKFHDASKCQSLQDRIITSYRQDFLKYAKKNQIENLDTVFSAIPRQLGAKFKYSNVDNETKSTSLKNALSLLIKAGVAYQCFHTDAQGFPLAAQKNEKLFKVFFFDIGLAQRLLNLDLSAWVIQKLDVKYLGGIAEQLVAQEYLSYLNPENPGELYYWHREIGTNNAEVDFIFIRKTEIVPAEVKSGVKGGLKSLNVFLASHLRSKYGLKISQTLGVSSVTLLEIPLYGLEGWLCG